MCTITDRKMRQCSAKPRRVRELRRIDCASGRQVPHPTVQRRCHHCSYFSPDLGRAIFACGCARTLTGLAATAADFRARRTRSSRAMAGRHGWPSGFSAVPAARAASASVILRPHDSAQPAKRGVQVGIVGVERASESVRRSIDRARGLYQLYQDKPHAMSYT